MGWAWLPVVFPSHGRDVRPRGQPDDPQPRAAGRPGRPQPACTACCLPLWLLGAVGVTGLRHAAGAGDRATKGTRAGGGSTSSSRVLPLRATRPSPRSLPGVHGVLGEDWAAELAGPALVHPPYLLSCSPRSCCARCGTLPWPTILAPLALSAAFQFGYLDLPGERVHVELTDFSTTRRLLDPRHGPPARHPETRLPRYVVPSVAPVILGNA